MFFRQQPRDAINETVAVSKGPALDGYPARLPRTLLCPTTRASAFTIELFDSGMQLETLGSVKDYDLLLSRPEGQNAID